MGYSTCSMKSQCNIFSQLTQIMLLLVLMLKLVLLIAFAEDKVSLVLFVEKKTTDLRGYNEMQNSQFFHMLFVFFFTTRII